MTKSNHRHTLLPRKPPTNWPCGEAAGGMWPTAVSFEGSCQNGLHIKWSKSTNFIQLSKHDSNMYYQLLLSRNVRFHSDFTARNPRFDWLWKVPSLVKTAAPHPGAVGVVLVVWELGSFEGLERMTDDGWNLIITGMYMFLFLVLTSSGFREFWSIFSKVLCKTCDESLWTCWFCWGVASPPVARHHPTPLSFDHQGCDTVRATAVDFSLSKL